jgi:hypothetical protein
MTKCDNTKHLSVLLYHSFKMLNLVNLLYIFYTSFVNICKHPKILICFNIFKDTVMILTCLMY